MKALVTGGTGFIGQWLVKALAEQGTEVILLHRGDAVPEELKPYINKGASGDVTNLLSVVNAIKGVDLVYHLAGVVGYDSRQRKLMEQVNVAGTQNVVNAALKENLTRFIHLSSVVAVGASFEKNVTLNENSPYNLAHLNMGYFETKRAAELIVLKAAREQGLPALCLNPSTVYGAGDALKGSRKMQVKVARGELKFFPPGGVNVVHIRDVIHCLLEAQKIGTIGERYIVSGENLLIRQLFMKIANIAGVKPPEHKLPQPLILSVGKIGDLLNRVGLKGPLTSENAWAACLYHWFDSSKAQETFKFKPIPADQALEESIGWMKTHGLLKKK